jgi:hypothetical protein
MRKREGEEAREAGKTARTGRAVKRSRGAGLRKGVDITNGAGLSVRGEREKGKWAAEALWAERKSRPAGGNWAAGEVGLKREEERVGDLGFCFFQTLFKTFSNFKFFSKFKHFQNFSRLKSF